MDAASKRELGILRRLGDGMKQIARKIMAMNAEFLEEEEVVRVTNEEFVTIRRDDLAGRYDIKLSISTAESENAKAQELAFMLQTMGNTMPFEMSQMILADIARLRKMPELAKRIEEYQPQPNPEQQLRERLEIQKLQAEINEKNAEAQRESTQASLNQAKTRETESNADVKDLDFLEQESGVKQERDLQKQGAQARANMMLKEREAQLKAQENRRNNRQARRA
jgi:hypothetical protein